MLYKLFIQLTIILFIFVCGCLSFGQMGYGDSWRNYSHASAQNVTINIYKTDIDHLTILNSTSNDVLIKEDVFYEVRKWVKNDTGNEQIIADYVNFKGNENNLSINISLLRMSDEDFTTNKAYTAVYVYLPCGTNYTVNYVGYNDVK